MAARLLIYNSVYNASTPTQLLAANLAVMQYPDITIKDVGGVTTGNITTYIGTLTDDYYTDIFITTTTQSSGATGLLSYDQVASLRAKMITASKGTTVRANSCQTNAVTTEIILDASASSTNDTYNGMFIVTAGTTAVYRYISDYVGSTVTCTVADTSTAITNTETYIIYTNTNIYELGNTDATTAKTAAYRMWATLYPYATVPLMVDYVGGYLFAECSGTASAVAAGTITLDATGASRSVGDRMALATMITADSVVGMYVYIYSASTGAGQYRQITTSTVTTAVCTLDSNWDVTPTGTVVYRVVSDINKIMADRALEIWIKTELHDPSSATAKAYTRLLCDPNSMATSTYSGDVWQDLDTFFEKVELGKFAFRADSTLYI